MGGLPTVGKRLSHYRILSPLGSGGMGVVYRARDERLERDVALKVLPAGALADEAARRQFRKEALALSKLNHPNIATVHDFDFQEGVDFLVMELVEGETLAECVRGAPLPEPEVARLGEQLAEGLSAAHRAGVLHRDIKPSNLRVTSEGRLKILDFGLARVVRAEGGDAATVTATGTGVVSGTVPYMAPEQLRGGELDERTDVWAAGAVLYEMATGRRPFAQEAQAQLITAILHEPPDPPRERNARVSPELDRIVLRCLEKDRDHRYQTARDLAADLKRLLVPSGTRIAAARARQRRRPAQAVAVALGLVALVACATLLLNPGGIRERILGGGTEAGASLAVLPLANLSGDPGQDYFADGMTDELITRLAQVGSLRVISRTSVMPYKGTRKSLQQIARELGVRMVMEGTVARGGDLVRISARLVEAASGRPIWAESYERTVSNVLVLQSDVARAVVEKVRVRVTPAEQTRLAEARPVNPEAHEAYLRGLAAYSEYSGESYQNALRHFRRAIEIDPEYASAHASLAATYAYLSGMWLDPAEAMPRARAEALRAIELDPNLATAHAVLAYVRAVGEWNWTGAEEGFRRALELNPGDLLAHQNYGAQLVMTGRFEEAGRQFALAREIDPLSTLTATMSLWPLFEGRRYDDAIREARKIVSVDSTANSPHMILGQSLVMRGDYDEGIAEMRRATELDPSTLLPVGWLAFAYARAGQRGKALDLLRRIQEEEKRGKYVQPYVYLLIYTGLGEKEKALDWLDRAFEKRSDEMALLKVDPGLDALRAEPRFQAILRKMAFPA